MNKIVEGIILFRQGVLELGLDDSHISIGMSKRLQSEIKIKTQAMCPLDPDITSVYGIQVTTKEVKNG
jgi:hypothetical protein